MTYIQWLCFQFDGTVGDTLVKVGAEFTKRQKWSIEELKKERARDQTVELYLREQEKRPECRRLGLQALLPVEHQRLVKYPLLLESLAKYCDKESEEFAKVKRCVERSREILGTIDQQVAEAQNVQRLAELQGSIDTSGLEKMPESAICVEYRVRLVLTYWFMTLDVCYYVHLVISIGTNWTNWVLLTMSLSWVETFFWKKIVFFKDEKTILFSLLLPNINLKVV